MKKSRLKRKTELKADPEKVREWKQRSRSRLKRSRLNPVNEERRQRNYEIEFGDKADWIRGLCCLVCGAKPCDPHHYPTRAAGGTKEDLTPLCRKHHRMFHDLGAETWQERFGIDLKACADRLEERWRTHQSKGE